MAKMYNDLILLINLPLLMHLWWPEHNQVVLLHGSTQLFQLHHFVLLALLPNLHHNTLIKIFKGLENIKTPRNWILLNTLPRVSAIGLDVRI
jgi:hypothetical protein